MKTHRIHLPAFSASEWRSPVLILTATVVLIGHYYLGRPDVIGVFSDSRGWSVMTPGALSPFGHFLASFILLAAIPVLVGRWVCGLRLREMGLGLGDWRQGLIWLAVGVPIALFAGWTAGGQPGMRAVYPLDPGIMENQSRFAVYAAAAFLYYGSWEILFRGVLLFGLANRVGAVNANGIQTALSVTAHFGRSIMETVSAVPGGFIFGFVTLRLRSLWYIAIIHWTLGMSTEWFASVPQP